MRRNHPTLDEIATLIEGGARSPAVAAAAEHLGGGCGRCGPIASDLSALLGALGNDRLTPLPADVRARALRALARESGRRAREAIVETAVRAIQRIAHLVLDSSAQPALAGVRGGVAPVRQLVYEWQGDRYALRVRRLGARAPYEVMGQILRAEGGGENVPVELKRERGRGQHATSGATGVFVFESVVPGSYSVVVGAQEEAITLPGLELP